MTNAIRPLPSRREFHSKLQKLGAAISIVSSLAVIAFAVPLLDLSLEQLGQLGLFMLIATAIVAGPILFLEGRACRPIDVYLDAISSGEADEPIRFAAFQQVFVAPRQLARNGFCSTVICGIIASTALYHSFETVTLFTAAVILASTITSGTLTLLLLFLGVQRIVEPIRDRLAQGIPDIEVRESLVAQFPLRQKILITVGSLVFASVVFGVCLAQVRGTAAIKAFVFGQHERILDAFFAQAETLGNPDAARRATQAALPDSNTQLYFVPIVTDPTQAMASVSDGKNWISAETMQHIQKWALTHSRGNSTDVPSVHPLSWRKISDTTLLVVATSADSYGQGTAKLRPDFFAVVGVAILISLLIAHYAFRNLEASIFALGSEMMRIASGDLRRGVPHESEDELGDIGRILEKMAQRLQITVGKIIYAADQVDETATQISDATAQIAAATLQQNTGVRHAAQSMELLRGQIQQITQSADVLNRSVQVASSSSTQLHVSSKQLRDDSIHFSNQIDNISAAIESITQNIQAIHRNTDATLELSVDVVAKADRGYTDVQATNRVVGGIQDSYQITTQRIQDLSRRALEIGSILEVIRLVSDQTMMLGLNAAVIAARSGEQAISFGVVAAEMQALSSKVAERTKEIEGIIFQLQKDSKNVLAAMKAENPHLQRAMQFSDASALALEKIAHASQKSGERFAEIAAAIQLQTENSAAVLSNTNQLRMLATQVRDTTDDQSKNTNRIAKNVSTVQTATTSIFDALQQQRTQCTQTATALERILANTTHNEEFVEQVSGVIQRLEFQSKELREKIAFFKIDDSPSGTQDTLLTSKSFTSAYTWALTKSSLFAMPLILLFLTPLVDLAGTQWRTLGAALLVLIVLQSILNTRIQNHWAKPILHYLQSLEANAASDTLRKRAFHAVTHLPIRLCLLGAISYGYSGIACSVALHLSSKIFTLFDAAVFAGATAIAGFLAQVFTFTEAHDFLAPYRNRLASEIYDTDARAQMTPRFTLRSKIVTIIGSLVLASAIFAVLMAHRLAQDSIVRYAVAQEERWLAQVAGDYQRHHDFAQAIAQAQHTPLADQIHWIHVAESDFATQDFVIPGLLREESQNIAKQIASERAGNSNALRAQNLFAWQKIHDSNEVLIATTPRKSIETEATTLQAGFFGLIAIALSVTLFIAYSVSREIERSVQALSERLQKIAEGNFLRGIPLESEDEFGELGRIVDRMAYTLRVTTQNAATASVRVDETSVQIQNATQLIHDTTAEQALSIQNANQSMQKIRAGVENIAGAATALNDSVAASASTTQQLSVASNQLRALADFFAKSAVEVSTTLQATAESIHSVDQSTIATRDLAQTMMDNVQHGKNSVTQTLRVMQRIENTTQDARQMTHQLHERTHAIGAILGIIREVANQTTMLGLNAAVLADRGGVEGKAFGVVAEEMQNLSKKVSIRTREIEGQISVLQEGGVEALSAIERTMQGVSDGVHDSHAVNDQLATIEEASSLSAQRIAEIEVALSRQRGKTETVGNNAVEMGRLAAAILCTAEKQAINSREITASIEAVHASAQQIHGALQSQMQQCQDATRALDTLVQKTGTNTEMVQNILRIISKLSGEAERLRHEIHFFQFQES